MPSSVRARAAEHHARQAAVTASAVVAARRALKLAKTDAERLLAVAAVVARYQLLSATTAVNALAAENTGQALANPAAFSGVTALGFPIADPLTVILDRYTTQLRATAAPPSRLLTYPLDRFVASEVADAGRAASQVEVVANPQWSGYVRVLRLPSCERCAVLAGRVYRYSEDFDRHDLCDCEMWPVEDKAQAEADGLVSDPVLAIERGQVRGLSKADTRAILEEGADVSQVINAHRGMRTVDLFGHRAKITLEGTTKHGVYGGHTAKGRSEGYAVERIGRYGYVKNQAVRRAKAPRLRPETLYRIVDEEYGGDREQAVRLLKLYGYILPWA